MIRRAAIYTRKSSEEGLEQAFNSLHAQREACAAYIASQRHEGWREIPDAFDDGGISGGTMERPALARLLDAVRARRVDIIVVYKVDRLTRSLADFARIVTLLDAHDVSFVAVTQQFSTSTSMGRLTLNVLLSFAQFEREVTAERIRDKIAASKRKGIWTGGSVPFGYDVVDKTLVPNPAEAESVRTLCRLYLEIGSITALHRAAAARGIVTKHRVRRDGTITGGRPFSRGNLHRLLASPVPAGLVPHKGELHAGRHAAIVPRDLWDDVQARLSDGAARRRGSRNAGRDHPLAGCLRDETGDRLTPTHTNKRGRRYRYYVSSRLLIAGGSGTTEGGATTAGSGTAAGSGTTAGGGAAMGDGTAGSATAGRDGSGWRLAAPMLERLVAKCIAVRLSETRILLDELGLRNADPGRVAALRKTARRIADELVDDRRRDAALAAIVEMIELGPTSVTLSLRTGVLGAGDDAPATIAFAERVRLQRRGQEARLVIGGARAISREPDARLVALILRAHRWHRRLLAEPEISIEGIAQANAVSRSEISQTLPLAYLAPDILEAILDGRQPVDLTAKSLKRMTLPTDWQAQRRMLGI